jgi:hypothetical protein
MSRTRALWTAGAVALLFSMLVGAVILRPVLEADADAAGNQPGISTSLEDDVSQDGNWEEEWAGEDDDYWEDEDDSGDEGDAYNESEDHDGDEGEDHGD